MFPASDSNTDCAADVSIESVILVEPDPQFLDRELRKAMVGTVPRSGTPKTWRSRSRSELGCNDKLVVASPKSAKLEGGANGAIGRPDRVPCGAQGSGQVRSSEPGCPGAVSLNP